MLEQFHKILLSVEMSFKLDGLSLMLDKLGWAGWSLDSRDYGESCFVGCSGCVVYAFPM